MKKKNALWYHCSGKKGKNGPKANSINCLKQHVHHSHFLLLIIIVSDARCM